jgi:TetR/AcrR family transcriptional regulator, transcriptional repressor for nem operon
MARAKEFDVEATLERAMNLFWERGYEATTMSDLVRHLGISRQSLYDTFGDKRALYGAALERNRRQQFAPFLQRVAGDEPLAQLLHGLLLDVIDEDLASKSARGCMFVNAAIELASSDRAIRKMVSANTRGLHDALVERLRRARERGEMATTQSAESLAHYFLTVVSGLRVLQKTTRDRRTLEEVARVALRLFE